MAMKSLLDIIGVTWHFVELSCWLMKEVLLTLGSFSFLILCLMLHEYLVRREVVLPDRLNTSHLNTSGKSSYLPFSDRPSTSGPKLTVKMLVPKLLLKRAPHFPSNANIRLGSRASHSLGTNLQHFASIALKRLWKTTTGSQ